MTLQQSPTNLYTASSRRRSAMNSHSRVRDVPALITSLLSSFVLNAAQDLLVSQSSRPQQHVATFSGSGDDTRDTLVRACVSSSIVAVARCKLLVSWESGVKGRESSNDIFSQRFSEQSKCVRVKAGQLEYAVVVWLPAAGARVYKVVRDGRPRCWTVMKGHASVRSVQILLTDPTGLQVACPRRPDARETERTRCGVEQR